MPFIGGKDLHGYFARGQGPMRILRPKGRLRMTVLSVVDLNDLRVEFLQRTRRRQKISHCLDNTQGGFFSSFRKTANGLRMAAL
jgi:hypothetical protein